MQAQEARQKEAHEMMDSLKHIQLQQAQMLNAMMQTQQAHLQFLGMQPNQQHQLQQQQHQQHHQQQQQQREQQQEWGWGEHQQNDNTETDFGVVDNFTIGHF